MSYYNDDVYHQPEKFDLALLVETDDQNASYSFHMVVVWAHRTTGKLYWAEDSGCFCPSPFEGFNNIESVTPLNPQTYGTWIQAMRNSGASLDARNRAITKVASYQMKQVRSYGS